MDWQITFIMIIVVLLALFTTGMPIAFCFLGLNILGGIFIFGGHAGLHQLMLAMLDSIWRWSLLPMPLFVIMGEVMFHSGVLPRMIDTLDEWVGRLPGRLSLLTVAAGVIFGTLSGSSVSSYALLGSTLTPEMERRGYNPAMSVGPILGSGGLAMMIPPSIMAVLLAALAEFSAGRILIAIIIPGLMMATIYVLYILLRCSTQPSLAPPYVVSGVSLSQKILDLLRYILPLAFIIFMVTGVIFLGVATPTEAAATGALAAFILTACYGKLNPALVKTAMTGSMEVIGMVLFIIMMATAFGQLLGYSGVTTGMIEFVSGLPLPDVVILGVMLVIMLIMGTFMDSVTVLMIAVPVVYPIVNAMGLDPVWFGVMMLMTVEMGMISPPFGMGLFVMKGVVSSETTLGDIYKSSLPFFACNLVILALILTFPVLTQWLPAMMRK